WPMSYLASPRWEVWVITDDGQPIPQINVRLVYKNYSAENASHEVTLRTDQNGHVLFPQHYEKACIFQQLYYTMSAGASVHGSLGRHAYVFAFGGGYEGDALTGDHLDDWHGSPDSMQSRIVAKRVHI